jgi:hypothetical protein
LRKVPRFFFFFENETITLLRVPPDAEENFCVVLGEVREKSCDRQDDGHGQRKPRTAADAIRLEFPGELIV